MSDINHTLKKYFGFTSLREGQETVINSILNGRSAAAIFPTGAGKSLCYQLPALLLPNLTLVISPLLALMKDQIDFMVAHDIPAASIDSTQTREESQAIIQSVKKGEIKILLISVERLKNERFRQFIKTVPISLMVVDEAHCISEWGHNFRPDYIKLPDYQKELKIKQSLLLTATATSQVIDDMSKGFSIDRNDIVVTGFYRKNLNITVHPCQELDKLNYLSNYLATHSGESCIVYVTLQKTAETVAGWLNNNGIPADAYHAGLHNDKRIDIQQRFMDSESKCIIATIAFGMGIDKSDIRHIIHFNLPKSIENYAQEIGRAGRDGEESNCVLLGNLNGVNVLENFVYGDTPESYGIALILNEIKNTVDEWDVITYDLSAKSDIRQLSLKTLLVYLEIEGIIEPKYSYFAEYKFKLLISEAEILKSFKGERRDFVEAIFMNSTKARIWYTLDIDNIQKHYQTDRQRILTALEYFQEKNWLHLESKQMTEVYQVLNNNFDLNKLVTKLHRQYVIKEQSQIHRISEMLEIFQSEKCLTLQLAHYFSDFKLSSECGHCSVCTGDYTVWPKKDFSGLLSHDEIRLYTDELNDLILSHFDQAASIELKCRYLCGITSPWLTKAKVRTLGSFGRYDTFAYAEIRSLLQSFV